MMVLKSKQSSVFRTLLIASLVLVVAVGATLGVSAHNHKVNQPESEKCIANLWQHNLLAPTLATNLLAVPVSYQPTPIFPPQLPVALFYPAFVHGRRAPPLV